MVFFIYFLTFDRNRFNGKKYVCIPLKSFIRLTSVKWLRLRTKIYVNLAGDIQTEAPLELHSMGYESLSL